MSKLRLVFLCFVVAAALVAAGTAMAATTAVMAKVPYASEGVFPDNVVRECTQLGTKIASFTKQYADKNGTGVELVSAIDFDSAPSALRIASIAKKNAAAAIAPPVAWASAYGRSPNLGEAAMLE